MAESSPLLKQTLDTDGDGRPSAPSAGPSLTNSGAPSAPPAVGGDVSGDPSGPPPYTGPPQGYGGVVHQLPAVQTQQPYGAPPVGANYLSVAVKPPNYMILNVFTALCCCLLCGIAGLYMGSQIDAAWDRGDREAAYKHSTNAKNWGLGGIFGGCAAHILVIIVVGVSVGISVSNFERALHPV